MKKIISLLIFTTLFSCNSVIKLERKTYELSDSQQLIRISFISNEVCEIEQNFFCINVPDSLKKTVIKAKYQVVKSLLPYKKDKKTKNLKVHFLKIMNSDTLSKKLPKYTYIPNYGKLCESSIVENSKEEKLRNKLISGVILNLVNDSLLLKKDTIFFGFKKVPFKNE